LSEPVIHGDVRLAWRGLYDHLGPHAREISNKTLRGAIHHVMGRGIERGAVFRGDSDRDHFVERFGEIIQDTQTPCYA
jgi:hypothetical protein